MPSRGVDAAGIPATSIPPGPQCVAAWPLARTWTRAPDSAAAMAAVSPARPAPMTTTSALGTDHLPGRFGRLVLDQRFDPQPTFVDTRDHPLLLQLAAGRDGTRSLEALPEEPEDPDPPARRRPPHRHAPPVPPRRRRPGTCRSHPGTAPSRGACRAGRHRASSPDAGRGSHPAWAG